MIHFEANSIQFKEISIQQEVTLYIPKLGHTKGSKFIQIIAKNKDFKVRKYIIQSAYTKHRNSIQKQVGAFGTLFALS